MKRYMYVCLCVCVGGGGLDGRPESCATLHQLLANIFVKTGIH